MNRLLENANFDLKDFCWYECYIPHTPQLLHCLKTNLHTTLQNPRSITVPMSVGENPRDGLGPERNKLFSPNSLQAQPEQFLYINLRKFPVKKALSYSESCKFVLPEGKTLEYCDLHRKSQSALKVSNQLKFVMNHLSNAGSDQWAIKPSILSATVVSARSFIGN